MIRFSAHRIRSLVGNSFVVGLAASALLVALVWTTSFATEGDSTSDTTVPATLDSTPTDVQTGDSTPSDSVPSDSVPTESSVPSDTSSGDLATQVAALQTAVTDLQSKLDAANALVTELQSKTALLAADGTYTGTIAPSQLSPHLRVSDVAGNWPLSRTDGDLPLKRVDIGFTTCRSDSRSYGVITVGAFRQLECVRVPK